jgi:hypothetical protein
MGELLCPTKAKNPPHGPENDFYGMANLPRDFDKLGAEKMGGFGSGGRSSRLTTSDAYSLDVTRLNETGALASGWTGGWEWKRNGERVADIRIETSGNQLLLIYRTRLSGDQWRDVAQPVTIIWSPCRFGGSRPLLCCPSCGRRSVKLFLRSAVACRTCHQLAYPSQREHDLDRALRRANNIRSKLGGDPGMASAFPRKPRGMHHATYAHMLNIVMDNEEFANVAIEAKFRRICGGGINGSDGGFWR